LSAKPRGADHRRNGLHRAYLYAPGSRPELVAKALAGDVDAVVLDLEDAVAPDAADEARGHVAAALDRWADGGRVGSGRVRSGRDSGPDVHVRVNRAPDGYDRDDLAAAVRPGLDGLRLPKAEDPDAVAAVGRLLDELEPRVGLRPGAIGLYPTVESAAGALAARDLATASPRVVRLAFGASDFLADVGARGDEDLATLHVRSHLVLASRAAGIGPPIDSVHTRLDDEAGLVAGAERARSLGFVGKSVVHPPQVGPVQRVFTPSSDEVAWADRVVAALGDGRPAATTLDGEFVDPAVVARARGLLALAGRG